MIKKICVILSLIILVKNGYLYSYGTSAGTILTNINTFNLKRWAENPGETIGIFTNLNGDTNWAYLTNITRVTVWAGYDISEIPSSTSATGIRGDFVEYVYSITNRANLSTRFIVSLTSVTSSSDWGDVGYQIWTNYSGNWGVAVDTTNLVSSYTLSYISSDEYCRIRVRVYIPPDAAAFSTNQARFAIWDEAWTNTGGDKWPGPGAAFIISSNAVDTNDSRDFQISYLTTTAIRATNNSVEVISAEDMVHTIYKFDGSQYLANTRLKINLKFEKIPQDTSSLYLVYNINKNPTGTRSDDIKIKLNGSGIFWYAVIYADNDSRINPGAKFNFIILADSEYYYQDGIDGNIVWSFNIKAIQQQRNNVSILRNLINPDKGDKAVLFYSLAEPEKVDIEVYTLSGEKIVTLFHGMSEAGERAIFWNGKNDAGMTVSEGLYFISFRTSKINELRKVVVVK